MKYGDLSLCKWMNAIFLAVEIMQVSSYAVCDVLRTVTYQTESSHKFDDA